MRILLDTCVFLWLQLDPNRVPASLREILRREQTRRFLSASVAWEISIKWFQGKLVLPVKPEEFIARARFASMLETVPIFESCALQTAKLPPLHKDPFDRILIAQAIEHGLAIATPDPLIRQYPVKTIWD